VCAGRYKVAITLRRDEPYLPAAAAARAVDFKASWSERNFFRYVVLMETATTLQALVRRAHHDGA
jgi:hypothetical protein